MVCPNCGVTMVEGYKFCPRCGYQYDLGAQRPYQPISPPVRKDDSKVILIVVVVVIVAIVLPIILAALLYVMVLGFGGTGGETTPAVQLVRTTINGGSKFTLTPPSRDVLWADVGFTLSDGSGSISWFPTYDEWALRNSTMFYAGGPSLLGDVIVWLNVTDLVGFRYMYSGDYLTVTTGYPYHFSTTATYSITLLYGPTGQSMCTNSFHF